MSKEVMKPTRAKNFFWLLGMIVVIGVISLLLSAVFSQTFRENTLGFLKEKPSEHEKSPEEDRSRAGAVASSNTQISATGMKVLQQGGNAVDAAVAMAYVSSIIEPHTSGPGGGGGALLRLPDGTSSFIDFREISDASASAREDQMGIPGFFAGLEYLQQNYGQEDREDLFLPAIELAENGIEMSQSLHTNLKNHSNRFADLTSPYFDDGEPVKVGTTVPLPDAAETLRGVQSNGAEHFYTQVLPIDQPSLQYTQDALEEYLVVKREPFKAEIRQLSVLTAPAPFSGSALVLYLKLVEEQALAPISEATPEEIVEFVDIAQQTNAVRQEVVADPLWGGTDIDVEAAIETTPTDSEFSFTEEEFISTTHISTVDEHGLVVSMTMTLGHFFWERQVGGWFLYERQQLFWQRRC